MAKPICVLSVDGSVIEPSGDTEKIWRSCSELTESLSKKMEDYHVFVIPILYHEDYVPPMDFKVFYEKDFTEIQYEELKTIIESNVNQFKTHL